MSRRQARPPRRTGPGDALGDKILLLTPSASRPTDGRATRWAVQRERRRDEFVEAALHAIARHGPEVSTEQIADTADLQRAIAQHLTLLIEHYLTLFGIDTRVAQPVAYGAVGMVDASTARWLEDPRGLSHGGVRSDVGAVDLADL